MSSSSSSSSSAPLAPSADLPAASAPASAASPSVPVPVKRGAERRTAGRAKRRRGGGGRAADGLEAAAGGRQQAGRDRGRGGRAADRGGEGDDEDEDEEDEDDGYTAASSRSPLLESYYRLQRIVPDGEWESWLSALQRRLPLTFRLSSINGLHRRLLQTLERDEFGIGRMQLTVEAQHVPSPAPLPWYPQRMAWYLPVSKGALRSVPQLSAFRSWLMAEFDQGNLNRQEAVSMIPTLLLDVQSHHLTLDVCAAPGSKTAQILESIHSSHAAARVDAVQGMVLANDADSQRAYMLVHQLKRLGSPAFLVTTHDGQHFPNLYSSDGRVLLFDRILCDVPCSGDGTLRKSPGLWSRWTPNYAYGLHPLQLQIACRALQMLRRGGLMVYSTCSFNPVENEAVVAELLRRFGPSGVRLVDVRGRLPGLRTTEGRSHWTLMDAEGRVITEEQLEGQQQQQPPPAPRLVRSLLPPSASEAAAFHLDRCIRILPHHQDTGGFFIALLEKEDKEKEEKQEEKLQQTARASSSSSPAATASSPSAAVSASSHAEGRSSFHDDPFIPMKPQVVQQIMSD